MKEKFSGKKQMLQPLALALRTCSAHVAKFATRSLTAVICTIAALQRASAVDARAADICVAGAVRPA